MNMIDTALIAGVCGTVAGAACLLMLRRQRVRAGWQREELQAELKSQLLQQREEFSVQVARLGRSVEGLELSAKSVEEAGRGLSRSRRSQAMQLLRSGISPESAATSLGMARREMHLIARVSRILTL
jgi:hypothetical protein